MTTSIPPEEMEFFYLTAFKDENDDLLFDIVHENQLDWRQPDIAIVPMAKVFAKMRMIQTIGPVGPKVAITQE